MKHLLLGLLLLSSQCLAAPNPDMTNLTSMGTGAYITPQCQAVTATHVVEGAVIVKALVGGKWVDVIVMYADKETDVAIIQVISSTPCKPLVFNKEPLIQGDTIYSLGYPRPDILHWELVLTQGVVASTNIFKGMTLGNLSTAPGNSGGPLLNSHGELVGISDAIYTDPLGLSFGSTYSLSVNVSTILEVIGKMGIHLELKFGNGNVFFKMSPQGIVRESAESIFVIGTFKIPEPSVTLK